MLAYRLLALDLDGTLTNSQKVIPPATREMLLEAQRQGLRLVLTSGRPTQGVRPLASELQMDRFGGFIISFNGGRISSCADGDVLYERRLPAALLPQLCALPKGRPLTAIVYDRNGIVTETPDNAYVQGDAFLNRMPVRGVENLLDAIDFPVHKFLYPGDAAYIAGWLPTLRKNLPQCSVYCSEPYYLEVMPSSVDKASALSVLLARLGLPRKALMACGDGFNDRSMIAFAGLGVAMANAQQVVKDAADYITLSNDSEGVAHAVQRFVFGGA